MTLTPDEAQYVIGRLMEIGDGMAGTIERLEVTYDHDNALDDALNDAAEWRDYTRGLLTA